MSALARRLVGVLLAHQAIRDLAAAQTRNRAAR